MYDTLMQMGRWFGFRRGYLDLCRLYTTKELCEWYREIALATEDLLEQFDEMAVARATPQEFGLKVMLSPSGLAITRAGAMRNGTTMKVSYSGSLAETVTFDARTETSDGNLDAIKDLVRQCDENGEARSRRKGGEGGPVWEGVPAELVREFLARFKTHSNSPKANSKLLAQYVAARNAASSPELTKWTVALVSLAGAAVDVEGHAIGLMTRAAHNDFESRGEVRIKRLLSPSDEEIGLTAKQVELAMEQTILAWERGVVDGPEMRRPSRPDPRQLRGLRGADNGLLLIYLISPEGHPGVKDDTPIPAMAISFPESADALASAIDYLVNDVYWDREMDEE